MRVKWMVLDQTTGNDGGGGAATAPATSVSDAASAAAAVVPVAPSSGGETSYVDSTPAGQPAGPSGDGAADDTETSLEEVFSDLASEDDGDVSDGQVAAKPAAQPAAPAKPVAQPAVQPAVPAQPAQAAQTTPSQPAQPAAPVQPAAESTPVQSAQPEPPTKTEEQIRAERVAAREKLVGDLATRYSVPEADISELVTNPEKVLPKMMAHLHANVMDNVQAYIAQNFHRWTEVHQTVAKTNSEAADSFFKEWPELKDKAHGPTVVRVLTAYRQANPQAKAEEVIREGGLQALVALRLPLPARLLGPGANNLHLPDASRPGAPPVHAGTAARAAPGKPEDNVFTILANEEIG